MLGGTTTWGDCATALRYLASPGELTAGPAIAAYEQAVAQAIGVRFAYSFSAGRVGLYGLLLALGVGPGDEVLLQVPTHIVVANAIRYTGATPVYVDCNLDNFTIDLEEAERRITPRSKVLLVQHTFGIPVEMDAVQELARRHGLVVIEDCVHSLGARYAGRPLGSFGTAAFFSTEETKTISSTMGGVVVTDEPQLASRLAGFQAACAQPAASLTRRYLLKLIAYHLLTEPQLHPYSRWLYDRIGRHHPLPRPTTSEELRGRKPPHYEQRFSNAQAALALRQLRRLQSNLRHRAAIAQVYARALAERGSPSPVVPRLGEAAYVRYPVWLEDRAAAARAAARRTVLGTWFSSVLEEAASPQAGGYVSGSCPRAELAAEHLANLPTHLRVQEQDAREIVSTLAEFLSVPPQAGDIPTTRDTSARLRDNAPIPGGVSAALG